jgi:hypothetical protein
MDWSKASVIILCLLGLVQDKWQDRRFAVEMHRSRHCSTPLQQFRAHISPHCLQIANVYYIFISSWSETTRAKP